MTTLITKKEFLQVTQAETLTVREFESQFLAECISFPIADLATLGTAFSALPSAFTSVAKAAKGGKVLYEATFPVAGKLAKAKDGS